MMVISSGSGGAGGSDADAAGADAGGRGCDPNRKYRSYRYLRPSAKPEVLLLNRPRLISLPPPLTSCASLTM